MQALAKLASKLYPRWWRERYGEEFEALLEDARPGLGGALDVLKGALTMRFTPSPSRRMAWAALALGLAGCLIAVLRVATPYSTVTTISVEPSQAASLAARTQTIYSRTEMFNMMREFDLFPDERNRVTTDELIAVFRDNLRVERTTPESLTIAFDYLDQSVARSVVKAVSSKFDQTAPLTTVPADPYSLGRLRAGFFGLVAGASLVLLYLLLAFLFRRATPFKAFATCAALGIAAGVAALTIPGTVTSFALLRAPGLEDPSSEAQLAARGASALRSISDEAMSAAIAANHLYPELSPADALVRVRGNLRVAPIRLGPTIAETVEFTYRNYRMYTSTYPYIAERARFDAYTFVNWAAGRLVAEDQRLRGSSAAFEILDPASMPQGPVRFAAVVGWPFLGVVAGAILALIVYIRRRMERRSTPQRSATGKLILAGSVAGLVIGVTTSFATAPLYVSKSVIAVRPADGAPPVDITTVINQYSQLALSRAELLNLIRGLSLYSKERTSMPEENVVEVMRKDIHIAPASVISGGRAIPAFEISFTYPDWQDAQQVVKHFVSRFLDVNAQANPAGEPTRNVPQILDEPTSQIFPNQGRHVFAGLGTGLALCGIAALFIRLRRQPQLA